MKSFLKLMGIACLGMPAVIFHPGATVLSQLKLKIPRRSSSCFVKVKRYTKRGFWIGPSEEVLKEILELFRVVFEFVMKTEWSYEKLIEFYHSFPFEELPSRKAIMAFRRPLVSCPTFDGFEWTFPEVEEYVAS